MAMGNYLAGRTCWRAPNSSEIVLFHSHYNWNFMPHAHDAATLLFVLDGAVEISIWTRKYIARKGQLAIIGANQVHSARPAASNGWQMRSLHLPMSEISKAINLPVDQCAQTHFANPVQSMASVGSMFLDLHQCTERMNPTCGDFHTFIGYLYDNMETFRPAICNESDLDERITKAREILARNIGDNVQIGEVAEAVGLSEFSLIRKFKRTFGISPHGWRIQARANEAARLLRQRTEAATTAALCGFSDQSHMVRTFKKVFGITPGQYV